MKKKFNGIKTMLTRDEMKQLKAGSGGGGGGGSTDCPAGSPLYLCSYPGISNWETSCCRGRLPNYVAGTTCVQIGYTTTTFPDGSVC